MPRWLIRAATPCASALMALALTAASPQSAQAQMVFFDDFNYQSSTDPTLLAFGWEPRTGGGGPGIGNWDGTKITFIADPANANNRLMQMAASTSGTAQTTIQTEMSTPIKFLSGTYGARVKFSDAPISGPNGDQLYQTFFTIANYKTAHRSFYSELDFEYLPHGYGSLTSPQFFFTSWETARKRVDTVVSASFAGWHTLVVDAVGGNATTGTVHYYVDGTLVATHTGTYYPDGLMAIDFNQWFPTGSLVSSSTPRTWIQQADWVYHAKDTLLSTAQVVAAVATFRNQGIERMDTVP